MGAPGAPIRHHWQCTGRRAGPAEGSLPCPLPPQLSKARARLRRLLARLPRARAAAPQARALARALRAMPAAAVDAAARLSAC